MRGIYLLAILLLLQASQILLPAQVRILQPTQNTPVFGGSDVDIRWSNAPNDGLTSPNDSVRIEYSINDGTSWDFLANARGGRYIWRNLPNFPTQRFRLRITELGAKISTQGITQQMTVPSAMGGTTTTAPVLIPHTVLRFTPATNASANCQNFPLNAQPLVFWKPDGKQVAVVNAAWNNAQNCTFVSTATIAVTIYNADNGGVLRQFSYQRTIQFNNIRYSSSIAYGMDMLGVQQNFWTPDGRLFAWWKDERTIGVWDASTWGELAALQLPRTEGSNILYEYNTAWRPDGSTLFLYRLQTQVEPATAVSPSGVAFQGLNPVSMLRSITEWQLGTAAPRTIIESVPNNQFSCLGQISTSQRDLFRDLGTSVHFSNNRQMAALSCIRGGIEIVNLQPLPTLPQNVLENIFTLTRDDLAPVAPDNLEQFPGVSFARNVAWSPTDNLLAIWGMTGNNNDPSLLRDCNCFVNRILLVNPRLGTTKVIQIPFAAQYWTNVSWSRDGRSLIVTGDVARALRFDDGDAVIISIPANGDIQQAQVQTRFQSYDQLATGTQYGRWNNPDHLWNPDNTRIAGGNYRRLDVWDAQRGDLLQTIDFPDALDLNNVVAWSPDGTKLISTRRFVRPNFPQSAGNLAMLQDTAAVLFNIPPANVAVSENFSLAAAPILAVTSGSVIAQLLCEEQGVARVLLNNIGAAELRISEATLNIPRVNPNGPVQAGLLSEFSVIRFPQSIAAGRTDTALVAFRSTRFGRFAGEVLFRSNALNSNLVAVQLEGRRDTTGIVFPNPIVDVPDYDPLNFQRSIRITNVGTLPLDFRGVEPLVRGTNARIEGVLPPLLAPGQTGFVLISLTPPVPLRTRVREELRLRDACGRASVISVSIGRSAVLEAPDVVNLGSIVCATSPTIAIPLQNTGNQRIFINGISAVSGDPSEFPLRNLPSDIGPNTTATIDFGFTPFSAGLKTFTIELITNSATGARKTITINARKDSIGFLLPLAPILVSGEQENMPIRQTFRIVNTGTLPLRWQTPIALGDKFTITSIEPQEILPNGGSAEARLEFRGAAAGFQFDTTVTLRQALCDASASARVSVRVLQVPRLAVDFPSLNLTCESTTLATVRLRNDGSGDTRLERVTLTGANAGEFRVESFPSLIPRGQSDVLRLRFTPSSQGTKQAALNILSNAFENTSNIIIPARKDSSGLQILERVLDFGAVGVQQEVVRSFSIQNRGTLVESLNFPTEANSPFTIVSVQPNPLPPNSTGQVRVRFFSGMGGNFLRRLTLRDACAREIPLEWVARAAGGILTLQSSIEAAPAREVEVPIFLRNRSGVSVGTRIGLELTVSNASLLEAAESMPPASNSVQNGIRTLSYTTAIASDNEAEPILRLKLRGLLGNDSVATLRISSLVVGGVSVPFVNNINPTSQVIMRGLNRTGGTRLFFGTAPTLAITQVFPNPTSNKLTVSIDAESAENPALTPPVAVSVKLINLLGNEHALWRGALHLASGSIASNATQTNFHSTHTLELSTEGVPAGAYFLEMQYLCASVSSDGSMQPCRVVRRVMVVR